ncbi:tetratricopeptide repeat protein [Vicingaceae bacterium]|nr:tetratricopeptide repeat protein [Vicingaceae bacterium]
MLAFQESDPIIASDDTPSSEQIESWIGNLGSNEFVVRQNATRSLWRHGRKHLALIRKYSNSADREIRARISTILQFVEAGITPDMPNRMARSIAIFSQADNVTREWIVDLLAADSRHEQIFDLLESLEEKDRVNLIYRTKWLRKWIAESLNNGDVETVEKIYLEPVIFSTVSNRAMFFFIEQGELKRHIATIKKSLSRNKDKPPSPYQLKQLLQLLVADNGENDLDPFYVSLQTDRVRLAGIRSWWAVSNYRWDALSESLSNQNPDEEKLYNFDLSAQLAIHRFAGQYERYEHCLEQYIASADSETNVGTILYSNFEIDSAVEYFRRDEPVVGFEVLCLAQRYAEAFELIGLPDTDIDRIFWYKKKVRSLNGLYNKLQRGVDREETEKRTDALFNQLALCAYHLGSLGNEDEAIFYLNDIADVFSDDGYQAKRKKSELHGYLARLERYDDAIEFGLKRLQKSSHVDSTLFPDNSRAAAYWYGQLSDQIPDAKDRIKHIGRMLKTNWCDSVEQFDLDESLHLAFDSEPQSKPERTFRLAEVAEVHGRHDLAKMLYAESANLDFPLAIVRLALLHWKNQRWVEAESWFSRANQLQPQPAYDVMRALCFQKLGKDDLAKELKQKAYILVEDDSYHHLIQGKLRAWSVNEEWKWLLERLLLTQRPGSYYHNYYHQRLAFLLNESKSPKAINHFQVYLLNILKDPDMVQSSPTIPVTISRLIATEQARKAFVAGNYEIAERILTRIQSAFRGDAGLAEDFVPLFESAGKNQFADKLFNTTANFYLNILDKHPDSALHLNNYAWICATCNRRVDKVLPYALRAVELKPFNSNYHDTLAEIYFRNGNRDEAIAHAERCIELNSKKLHYQDQLKRFQNETIK